jgi:hypothetical protein
MKEGKDHTCRKRKRMKGRGGERKGRGGSKESREREEGEKGERERLVRKIKKKKKSDGRRKTIMKKIRCREKNMCEI